MTIELLCGDADLLEKAATFLGFKHGIHFLDRASNGRVDSKIDRALEASCHARFFGLIQKRECHPH